MPCIRPCVLLIACATSLATLSALGGCASTASDCSPPLGKPDLTPARVSATGAHTGGLQRWGGTLVSTRNLPDSTELEVIAYPMNGCGRPRLGSEPVGRFLVRTRGFLEPMDYQPGRQVTATGLLAEIQDGRVGGAPYRFPVLEDGKVKLWPSAQESDWDAPYPRPWVNIGIGGGSGGWGGWGGGVGVGF